jgi:adenosylmethionine-8-amino-7-oxononanoate aminotransferase
LLIIFAVVMAPSAIMCGADNSLNGARDKYNGHAESAVLHRNIKQVPPVTIQGTGNYLILEDGRRILDTAGGAAVSCLGYDKMPRIDAAIIGQLGYIPFHLCSTNVAEELARFMVDSTQGKMSKFSMYNSGE